MEGRTYSEQDFLQRPNTKSDAYSLPYPCIRYLTNLAIFNVVSSLCTFACLSATMRGSCLAVTLLRASTASSAVGSLLCQLLVGADQCLAVVDPLHYHSRSSPGRCLAACLSTWALAIVAGIVAAILGLAPRPLTAAVGFVLLFAAPFTLLAFTYARIFAAARGNSARNRRLSVCSSTLDSVTLAQQFYQHQLSVKEKAGQHAATLPPTSRGLSPFHQVSQSQVKKVQRQESAFFAPFPQHHHHHVQLMTSRQNSRCSVTSVSSVFGSLASGAKHAGATILRREESRAARVAIFVVLGAALCWGPRAVTVLATGTETADAGPAVRCAALLCASLSPSLTSLLFAYRSRNVRRHIRRGLGLRRRTCSSQHGKRLAPVRSASSPGSCQSHYRLPANRTLSLLKEKGEEEGESTASIVRVKSFSCPQLPADLAEQDEFIQLLVAPAISSAEASPTSTRPSTLSTTPREVTLK